MAGQGLQGELEDLLLNLGIQALSVQHPEVRAQNGGFCSRQAGKGNRHVDDSVCCSRKILSCLYFLFVKIDFLREKVLGEGACKFGTSYSFGSRLLRVAGMASFTSCAAPGRGWG